MSETSRSEITSIEASMFSIAVFSLLILSFQSVQGKQGIKTPEIPQNVESFEKSSRTNEAVVVRANRSVKNITCPHFTNNAVKTLNENSRSITCDCLTLPINTIVWLDLNCNPVTSNAQIQVNNNTLTITYLSLNNSGWLFYCTNHVNCTSKITVSEKIEVGMSRALQGFVMFLIITTVIGILAFVFRQYRYQIYLGCRDCSSPKTDDVDTNPPQSTCQLTAATRKNFENGQEFDAYISVGKSISDIKFVEKNIVDVLQLKHNYKLFVDDDNLLPRLDYSENVQTKMHLSRRLIVVFTPAYMTNEWCMYCFSEGLRKLLDLKVQMIFIVTDISIKRELDSLSSLIGHVPKLFFSTLPMMQSKSEKERVFHKLRLLMPPSPGGPAKVGIKAPMLVNSEDIDQRSVNGNDTYGGTKYTFGNSSPNNQKDEVDMEDIDVEQQELQYDDEDPASIRVNQYKPRLDFLKITMDEDDLK